MYLPEQTPITPFSVFTYIIIRKFKQKYGLTLALDDVKVLFDFLSELEEEQNARFYITEKFVDSIMDTFLYSRPNECIWCPSLRMLCDEINNNILILEGEVCWAFNGERKEHTYFDKILFDKYPYLQE